VLDRDILFLQVKTEHKEVNLPAQPFFVRSNAPKIGEAISLYAVPYSETEQPQRVYRGSIMEVVDSEIRFTIHPPVVTRGFSGAPIVDAYGNVLAVYRARAKVDEAGDSIEGFASILTDVISTLK
jgi:hypothetical protein